MNKTLLTGSAILAFFVILSGAFFVYNKSKDKTSNTTSTTSSTTKPIETSNVVTIKSLKFSPGELTIKAGTQVTWKNDDSVLHDVTIDDGLFDKDIEPGQSFSFTFDTKGEFPYHCDIHTSMTGKIIVE